MFVTSFIGLLTFGLVFNHAATNLITKSSEDENSDRHKHKKHSFVSQRDLQPILLALPPSLHGSCKRLRRTRKCGNGHLQIIVLMKNIFSVYTIRGGNGEEWHEKCFVYENSKLYLLEFSICGASGKVLGRKTDTEICHVVDVKSII
ncbi:CLUMA_CG005180, isoform A [Clunio marinus]|uniref:CLUMA_CG005180, isoform A n=1 Tax=Clunio marinus TaxID=568069 RepID=A0A1J1HTW9_9DIPT|nr:CLUMA_CG005180, isoform A [Clunio marinus]